MSRQGTRISVSQRRPRYAGFCDRCNFVYDLNRLRWQFDYRGNALQNLRILVCDICEDKPFELNRPIIIGPDPVPPRDPRPGFQAYEEAQGPQWELTDTGEIITGDDGIPIVVNP